MRNTVDIPQQRSTGFNKEFDTLFNDLYPALVHYAQKHTGDLLVSEDLVQGVFIKFWTNFQSSNNKNAAKNFLFRSVYNASIDHIRHRKVEEKRQNRYLYIHDDFDTIKDLMAETEIRKRIENAKNSLPEKCRHIFHLSRDEGLSYKEIAEQLDISIKTVETQVSKALRVFRLYLKGYLSN